MYCLCPKKQAVHICLFHSVHTPRYDTNLGSSVKVQPVVPGLGARQATEFRFVDWFEAKSISMAAATALVELLAASLEQTGTLR